MTCHYWFFNHEFKFQHSFCNGCRDLTMLCVNIRSIGITTNKDVDYRCIIHNSSKSEAIYLLENSVLVVCEYI